MLNADQGCGLGELQLEKIWSQSSPVKDIQNFLHKRIHGELHARHIHGNLDRLIDSVLPTNGLSTGSLKDVRSERNNKPALFRYRNKLQWWNLTQGWVRPASQCLKANDRVCCKVEFRLVMNRQFAVCQCAPQFILEGKAFTHRYTEIFIEKDDPVFPAPLGEIHCAVCLLQQVIIVHPWLRKNTDSDARTNGRLVALNDEGLSQRIQQTAGYRFSIPAFLDAVENYRKLVSSYAGEGVGFSCSRSESPSNFHQKNISCGVSKTVVHKLEAVQIDVEQCELGVLAPGCCQALRETISEQSSVRQPSQFVDECLVLQPSFGLSLGAVSLPQF